MLESLLLTSAAAIDVFAGAFAYGCNKIKIPLLTTVFMTIDCTFFILLAYTLGSYLKSFFTPFWTMIIAFSILFIIGLIKLLDWGIKALIRRYLYRKIKFCWLDFRFILSLYANPEKADYDESKTLSIKESIPLSFALTIDGMVAAFSLALSNINGWYLVFWALITHFIAINLGSHFGNSFAKVSNYNIEWLSGTILMIMAFSKLFYY